MRGTRENDFLYSLLFIVQQSVIFPSLIFRKSVPTFTAFLSPKVAVTRLSLLQSIYSINTQKKTYIEDSKEQNNSANSSKVCAVER